MTLLEWGALGELIGGIAIIVSLIYVGLQIKQNAYALKLSTAHDTIEVLSDLYLVPAQNSELADIFFRGLQDINALEGVDRLRFYGFLHKFFRTYENTHYQFTRGALESEPFEGITKEFIFITLMPGGQVYWQERKSWYSEEFQAYVDRELTSPDREKFKLAGT